MSDATPAPPFPAALQSSNPLRWITVFGPGAIMASLTIGTGELIFSSRGGAIFGYRILFLFAVISIFKWVLVYSAARHMVLTGAHPYERWLDLPGPRGWLPAVMFVFAAVCFPIWVSFHASVVGDLMAGLTGTKHVWNGATIHLWGIAVLTGIMAVALAGGYTALERIQLAVVAMMLLAVLVALVLLQPDWWQILLGTVVPQRLEYPRWLLEDPRPLATGIASTPVWVEASLYVGVVGGASYDYLAYTSFLRNKHWGAATNEKRPPLTAASLKSAKPWLRAPLVDCVISFLVVIVFSAVFVASGAIVLAPRQQIPGDGGFLEHQAQFLTQLHPWLYPLYVAGTLLTMLGTLYGTLEVAPPMLTETLRLFREDALDSKVSRRLRRIAILWSGGGAFAVLVASFWYQVYSGEGRPPGLTKLLIPASLFTGVLSCGFICLLNPWMDRVLPRAYRMPLPLKLANLLAGLTFMAVGLRAYWKLGGFNALGMLLATVAVGCVVATAVRKWWGGAPRVAGLN